MESEHVVTDAQMRRIQNRVKFIRIQRFSDANQVGKQHDLDYLDYSRVLELWSNIMTESVEVMIQPFFLFFLIILYT